MYRLRSCREQAGLSQKQVALEIGVKPPTVSQWESGIKTPSRANIEKLANLYGVTVDYLLNRTDECARLGIDDLSDEELKLIQDYRSLNRQGQEYIRQTMYMAVPIYIRHSDVSGMEGRYNTQKSIG